MENLPQQQMPGAAPVPKKNGDAVARQYAFGVLMAMAVTVSFAAGVYVGDLQNPSDSVAAPAGEGRVLNKDAPTALESKDVDFQQFWDIWKTVKARHVGEPPSDVKMYYGAIAGMVASLGDPYSVFFDPDYAQEFAQELGGEFEGIGAEIGIKQDRLTVVAPLPGSPAEKAGIKAGDRILAIDGKDSSGMPVDQAVSLIRGDKGTVVKLLIGRDGLTEPKEIEITRARIIVESVRWKMVEKDGKRVAHITLSQFNDKTTAAFAQAVRSVLPEDPSGIILDLRNNPGGYLDTAVEVAGEWIANDVVVIEKFGDGAKKPYSSDGSGRLADVPTVVLLNEGSASASEILAGALQDYGKAVIVGEKSFGKGSVQDYQEFGDLSALKLTVALWYTPKDRSINKEGIAPDVAVEMTTEDYNADRDPQFDKAVEMLVSGAPLVPAPQPTAAPAPKEAQKP